MDYVTLSNAALAAALRQQRGGALLPHFRSAVSYQRGRGLGGLLRGLFRRVTPILKKPIIRKGLKTLGKAAATAMLEAGQQALQDEGPSFTSALKASSQRQAQQLIREARRNMTGQGLKRPRKRKAPVSRSLPVRKRRRVSSRDIFG